MGRTRAARRPRRCAAWRGMAGRGLAWLGAAWRGEAGQGRVHRRARLQESAPLHTTYTRHEGGASEQVCLISALTASTPDKRSSPRGMFPIWSSSGDGGQRAPHRGARGRGLRPLARRLPGVWPAARRRRVRLRHPVPACARRDGRRPDRAGEGDAAAALRAGAGRPAARAGCGLPRRPRPQPRPVNR